MKLFFDEDMGSGVPKALYDLNLDGVSVLWAVKVFRKRRRAGEKISDEIWIPFAGQAVSLAISANRAILESDPQRELLIEHNVGSVFMASGEYSNFDTMKLLLRKWGWLNAIHLNEPRPFAYIVNLAGRTRKDPRVFKPEDEQLRLL